MGRAGNYGGGLAELIRVPFATSMLAPLPQGADPEKIIGLADMATDAWRAVGPQLALRSGAHVLVTAGPCPVISLYAAGLAVTLGAQRVDYVDADASHREIALRYGARAFERIAQASGPYDIVVDGASDAPTLIASLNVCAPDAIVTSIAPPFTPPDLPLSAMYHKGITWRIARPDCRAGHAGALDAWATKGFRPELVGPKLYPFEEAIDAWLDPAPHIAVALAPR
jgi:alcohol dehydrogenase